MAPLLVVVAVDVVPVVLVITSGSATGSSSSGNASTVVTASSTVVLIAAPYTGGSRSTVYSRMTRPCRQSTSSRKFKNGSVIGSRVLIRISPVPGAAPSCAENLRLVRTKARSIPALAKWSFEAIRIWRSSRSPSFTARKEIRASRGSFKAESSSMSPKPRAFAPNGKTSSNKASTQAGLRIVTSSLSLPHAVGDFV